MTNEQVLEKAEKIGQLKLQIGELEEEAKRLQSEILDAGIACDLVISTGKLSFTVRENYAITDKAGIIKEMGRDAYIQYSNITKTGIVSAVGNGGFKKYMEKGLVDVSSVSEFFTFRKNKK